MVDILFYNKIVLQLLKTFSFTLFTLQTDLVIATSESR